jgi:excisionase family DNA binding protein
MYDSLTETGSESKLLDKEVLNKKETSEYLGISLRHLDNLVSRRAIPFSRVGGRIVFRKKRLIQYLDSTDSLGGL